MMPVHTSLSLGFMDAHTDPRARAVVEYETAALKLTMLFAFNRRSAVMLLIGNQERAAISSIPSRSRMACAKLGVSAKFQQLRR